MSPLKHLSYDTVVNLILFAVAIILFPGIIVFAAHQEAKIFNRLSERDVTTWEAIWVKLRVEDCK